VNQRHPAFWIKYAGDGDAKRMVNHARNVWERGNILPRVDQLWYKYIHMEEMLNQWEVRLPLPSDSVLAPQRNSARMMRMWAVRNVSVSIGYSGALRCSAGRCH
jgi:hypothetical protein